MINAVVVMVCLPQYTARENPHTQKVAVEVLHAAEPLVRVLRIVAVRQKLTGQQCFYKQPQHSIARTGASSRCHSVNQRQDKLENSDSPRDGSRMKNLDIGIWETNV